MKEGAKILIAVDGSECSDAALDDLIRAGLPEHAEALILSVAEVWLPLEPEFEEIRQNAASLHKAKEFQRRYEKSSKAIAEAEDLVKLAEKRLLYNFRYCK